MSDSQGGSNEPSMEEILASIRRIIAEDAVQEDRGAPPPAGPAPAPNANVAASAPREDVWPEDREAREHTPAPRENPSPEQAPAAADEEPILELTQLVNEDGSVTDLAADTAGRAMPFVREDEDQQHEERREQPYENTVPEAQAREELPPAEVIETEERIEDAELEEEHRDATEAAVQTEIRAWLDQHLPEVVERVVREEVERMLRRLKDT